jgi:hypothetical protein
MSFGTRAECEGYMQRVQKAQAAVVGQKQITPSREGQAGAAARHLRIPQFRRYGADGGLAGARGREGRQSPSPSRRPGWNVLAEDYWDLYTCCCARPA